VSDFSNASSKKLGLALVAHITGKPDAKKLVQAAASEGNWVAKKLSRKDQFIKPQHSPTILIVDDEIELTEIYSDFLSSHNYKTSIAHNYAEAMAKIHANPNISLIILDLKLPQISGLQILKKLQEMKIMVGVPKILCTAFASPDLVAKARELGAVYYLIKPINFDDFLYQVEKYTAWKDAL